MTYFQMHRIRLSGLVEISFVYSRALHFQLHQSPLCYIPCITPRQRNYGTVCDWLPKPSANCAVFSAAQYNHFNHWNKATSFPAASIVTIFNTFARIFCIFFCLNAGRV